MAEGTASKETKPAAKESKAPAASTRDEELAPGAAPEGESEAQGMTFEELEPKPAPASLSPVGANVTGVEVFADEDGETPDAGELSIVSDVDYEADEVEPFEGELVTSLQAAGGAGGAVVAINGNSYLFSATQLGVLSSQLSSVSGSAT